MQVFKIEPNIGYSGGVALVAAKSIDQAIRLYCNDDYRDYVYDWNNCTCNLIVGLDYDTDTPKIILDEIYTE